MLEIHKILVEISQGKRPFVRLMSERNTGLRGLKGKESEAHEITMQSVCAPLTTF
jgi:hypothetical protein